jgi:hypothetical protein
MTRTELDIIATALAPVVRDYVTATIAEVGLRVQTLDVQLAGLVTATTEIGAMRERLAVLETRAPVPGPPGPAGRDGVDGLGFDDLAVEQVDDTTVNLSAIRGDIVKGIGSVTFPVATFKGAYEQGCGYTPGNLVRYQRAIWHCHKATSLAPDGVTYDASGRPAGPQGKDFWTLLIADGKRGNDGKNGAPGPAGPMGKDWQQVYDDTRRR